MYMHIACVCTLIGICFVQPFPTLNYSSSSAVLSACCCKFKYLQVLREPFELVILYFHWSVGTGSNIAQHCSSLGNAAHYCTLAEAHSFSLGCLTEVFDW